MRKRSYVVVIVIVNGADRVQAQAPLLCDAAMWIVSIGSVMRVLIQN